MSFSTEVGLLEPGLFNPIYASTSGQSQRNEKLAWLGRIVEPYFDLGDKGYRILPGMVVTDNVPVQTIEGKPSWMIVALRVMGYVLKVLTYLTGLIPLLMFIGKLAYRSENTFRIQEALTKRQLEAYLEKAQATIDKNPQKIRFERLDLNSGQDLLVISEIVRHIDEEKKLYDGLLYRSSASLTNEDCDVFNLAIDTLMRFSQKIGSSMTLNRDKIISTIRTYQKELTSKFDDPNADPEIAEEIGVDLKQVHYLISYFEDALDVRLGAKNKNWTVDDSLEPLLDQVLLNKVSNKLCPKGIVNLGATCFMNASIQALIANPVIREKIKKADYGAPIENDLSSLFTKQEVMKDQADALAKTTVNYWKTLSQDELKSRFQRMNDPGLKLLFERLIKARKEGVIIPNGVDIRALRYLEKHFEETKIISNDAISWESKLEIFGWLKNALQDYIRVDNVMSLLRQFVNKYEQPGTKPGDFRDLAVALRAAFHEAKRMDDGLYAQNDASPIIEYVLGAIGHTILLQGEREAKIQSGDHRAVEKVQPMSLVQVDMDQVLPSQTCNFVTFQDIIDKNAKGNITGDSQNTWEIQVAQEKVQIEQWKEKHTIAGPPPKYVQIHFKRFQTLADGQRVKIDTPIDFGDFKADFKGMFSAQHENALYRLKSGVIHRGGLGGGHYYTVGEKGGQWFKMDDSRIEADISPQADLRNAYVTFWERID